MPILIRNATNYVILLSFYLAFSIHSTLMFIKLEFSQQQQQERKHLW